MDNENRFWIMFWCLIAVVVISVMAIWATYYHNRNQIMAELVHAGYSPIEVSCMVDDSLHRDPTCIILTLTGKEVDLNKLKP